MEDVRLRCSRCGRVLKVELDGPCEICIWCQEDDYRFGRTLPPGAIIKELHRSRLRKEG